MADEKNDDFPDGGEFRALSDVRAALEAVERQQSDASRDRRTLRRQLDGILQALREDALLLKFDGHGDLVEANGSFDEHFGMSGDEVVSAFEDLADDETLAAIDEANRAVLSPDGAASVSDGFLRNGDESLAITWVHIQGFDDDGEAAGVDVIGIVAPVAEPEDDGLDLDPFDMLFDQLSRRLLDDAGESSVTRAVQLFGDFLLADRVVINRYDEDDREFSVVASWLRGGTSPLAAEADGLSISELPWAYSALGAGETLTITADADLPPEADNEKAVYAGDDARSSILIPMLRSDNLTGFVSVQTTDAERDWSDADVARAAKFVTLVAAAQYRAEIEADLAVASAAAEAAAAAGDTAEARAAEAAERETEANQRAETAESRATQLERDIEAARDESKRLRERADELETVATAAKTEAEEAQRTAEGATGELDEARDAAESARSELEELRSAAERAQRTSEDAAADALLLRKELEDAREQIRDALREAAEARSGAGALATGAAAVDFDPDATLEISRRALESDAVVDDDAPLPLVSGHEIAAEPADVAEPEAATAADELADVDELPKGDEPADLEDPAEPDVSSDIADSVSMADITGEPVVDAPAETPELVVSFDDDDTVVEDTIAEIVDEEPEAPEVADDDRAREDVAADDIESTFEIDTADDASPWATPDVDQVAADADDPEDAAEVDAEDAPDTDAPFDPDATLEIDPVVLRDAEAAAAAGAELAEDAEPEDGEEAVSFDESAEDATDDLPRPVGLNQLLEPTQGAGEEAPGPEKWKEDKATWEDRTDEVALPEFLTGAEDDATVASDDGELPKPRFGLAEDAPDDTEGPEDNLAAAREAALQAAGKDDAADEAGFDAPDTTHDVEATWEADVVLPNAPEESPSDPMALPDTVERTGELDAHGADTAAVEADPTFALPGIDTEEGLREVGGNTELYENLLGKFRNDYLSAADKIDSAIGKGNIEVAHLLLNAIKGVSGMLGATHVRDTADDLEMKLIGNDDAATQAAVTDFTSALHEVLNGIAEMEGVPVAAAAAPESSGTEMVGATAVAPTAPAPEAHVSDPMVLRSYLSGLRQHLLAEKTRQCQLVMREITARNWPDDFNERVATLAGFIEAGDFESARETFDDIMELFVEE